MESPAQLGWSLKNLGEGGGSGWGRAVRSEASGRQQPSFFLEEGRGRWGPRGTGLGWAPVERGADAVRIGRVRVAVEQQLVQSLAHLHQVVRDDVQVGDGIAGQAFQEELLLPRRAQDLHQDLLHALQEADDAGP